MHCRYPFVIFNCWVDKEICKSVHCSCCSMLLFSIVLDLLLNMTIFSMFSVAAETSSVFCSDAVCMLQVAVMINALQFINPVMLHTGNIWGLYTSTLHCGNTAGPSPQAAYGCTLQCALQYQCAAIRWRTARCYCAYRHSTATFCKPTGLQSPEMRKLILVHRFR